MCCGTDCVGCKDPLIILSYLLPVGLFICLKEKEKKKEIGISYTVTHKSTRKCKEILLKA